MPKVKISYGELAEVLRGIANDECNGKAFREITTVDNLISWLHMHNNGSRVIVDVDTQDEPPYKPIPPKDVAHIEFGKQSVLIDDIIDKAVDQALHSVIEDLSHNYGNYDNACNQIHVYLADTFPSALHHNLANEALLILDGHVTDIKMIAKKGHIEIDKDVVADHKEAISKILASPYIPKK